MSIDSPASLNPPIVLKGGPWSSRLTDAEFFEFCRVNRDWRIERTQEGDLVIMPPTGGETGRQNLAVAVQLGAWSLHDASGVAFDSSTGFRLPSGATRSPDASWVRRERWESLAADDRSRFPPLAPDFVAEIRSPTDRIEDLRAKMHEYAANGVRLGWLIDPVERRVETYRPGEETVVVVNPVEVSGDPELRGFVLQLRAVWDE